jgi:Pyruvate/2-oxoacid:ferredoxin oxidoreductase delta subunit
MAWAKPRRDNPGPFIGTSLTRFLTGRGRTGFSGATPSRPKWRLRDRVDKKLSIAPCRNSCASNESKRPSVGSTSLKEAGKSFGADDVGVARMDPNWVFERHRQDTWTWAIAIAVQHDYDPLKTAPEDPAATEVVNRYGRALKVIKARTGRIRDQGWAAEKKSGPMAGSMVMTPAATKAGFGELGRHGSVIRRTFGANFGLAPVLRDLPLEEAGADVFDADDFCTNCRVCSDACLPQALASEKQWVRGVERWYVNFDKCLPFFNENKGCGIRIAVCPWSGPGRAESLVKKMARRRARAGTSNGT